MVLEALNGLGGVEYLRQQAVENPSAFLSLLGKLVPKGPLVPVERPIIQVITGISVGDPPTCAPEHTPAALLPSDQRLH